MSQDYVQSVIRAFSILDFLRKTTHQKMGVSDIARALDLKTTTAYRLMQTLVFCKVLEQDEEDRSYHLAPQMLLYGKAVLDRFDFIGAAHPVLGELSKAVGETVFMGILDDFELVYVDHVDSLDHNLRMTPQIGRRQPAHCTALGKVLLANLPPRQLEMYLETNQLQRLTENTLIEPEAVRQELETVRHNGYALDQQETETGICCVAAAVSNINGEIVAAISVSGPAPRMHKKGLETFLRQRVQETAQEISRLTII